jgi:hypothetical protein
MLPSRNRDQPAFAALPGWFYNRTETAAATGPLDPGAPATETLPPYFYDASLLFRHMAALQVDRSALAEDDPLLFRELQGRCTLCRNKERCIEDLAIGFGDAAWARWRDYCVNAATLTTLGAAQNCGRAAQHLKMPRSPPAAGRSCVARECD